jgi:hypothetical protein
MATSSDLLGRRRATARRLPAVLRGSRVHQSWYLPTVRGLGLVALGLVVFVVMSIWPGWVPIAAYAPLVLLAGLYLTPGWLLWVSATYLVEVIISTSMRGWAVDRWVSLVSIGTVVVLMLSASRSRARLGVQGHHGESMFVDLRDRLRAFGELPELPPRWHAEVAVESAYGQSFSGDFVVATRSSSGRWLEVVLVDVSGKGVQAGTRSLLLSGALGGLLGEVEPERFLGAANSYLLRQRWDEGFATAVHVSIDLTTGEYSIGNAGHPAAVQFVNGSGRWQVLGGTSGPLLGVIEDATFQRASGRLARGDALVLYTDGVIESRHRDLTVGVDRMLGAAERLVPRGFAGGAQRLCASAKAGETDDRAVVLIWRD